MPYGANGRPRAPEKVKSPIVAEHDWVAVIVEDDPDVRDLIDIVLTQSGFRTVVCPDGPAGVEAVRAHDPLITTLDVNMPGMDGFAVAKRLREFSSTYLIMITALADEIDVVQGFEAGADDYLVKPFRPRELRARADSMLRRPRARHDAPAGWSEQQVVTPHPVVTGEQRSASPAAAAAVTAEPVRGLRLNGLVLDEDTRVVTVDGTRVDLTRTEVDLLASLLTTGRRVRSKADLVLAMRGQQYVSSYFVAEDDKRSLETHVANLRHKLRDEGPVPRFVETIRGVGYRAAEPA